MPAMTRRFRGREIKRTHSNPETNRVKIYYKSKVKGEPGETEEVSLDQYKAGCEKSFDDNRGR